jgi:hypothetical protein
MGMEGDQSLDFAQNNSLAQSPADRVEVYLFEVFEGGKYMLRGHVEKVPLSVPNLSCKRHDSISFAEKIISPWILCIP